MPKGNPNSAAMRNNFVAKIYDQTDKKYKPIYQAPDATDKVRGDVYLSDSVTDKDNAATGVTAATPLAVRNANDNANNRLSKTQTAAQTVASPVTFSGKVTGNGGFEGNLTGNVTGNADSATKLQTARNINVRIGKAAQYSASFNGTDDATIMINQVDASAVNYGMLPVSVIPPSVQERMKSVSNATMRFSLTKDDVQNGDTVYQADSRIMYMVVDSDNLNNESGYQEYQVGTSARLGVEDVGSQSVPIYLNKGVPAPVTKEVYSKQETFSSNDFTNMTGDVTISQVTNENGTYELNSLVGKEKITREKLAMDVGITQVSQEEPTDMRVQLWVQPDSRDK